MIKAILSSLWRIIKSIGILFIFLAVTFLLLETIKYHQSGGTRTIGSTLFDFEKFDTSVNGIMLTSPNEEIIDDSMVELSADVFDFEDSEKVVFEKSEELDAFEKNEETTDKEVFDYLAMIEEYELEEAVDEESYKLYEEELPQDILLNNVTTEQEEAINTTHKDIKDIKIEPAYKPAYFSEAVIAIVIDDMGISKKRTEDINSLKYHITSSFLTYGDNLQKQMSDSINAGHEVMAHIPMEAKSNADIAPDVLKVSMSNKDIVSRLEVMLNKFDNIKGINNHMGSKFTENSSKMDSIMSVLKDKNLFFLDSRTSPNSKGKDCAIKFGVDYATRNIFLDNENNLEYILSQLKATEKVAKKNGYAIAIGHPKSQTYLALKQWLPTLEKKGVKLVYLSEIVNVLNKPQKNS